MKQKQSYRSPSSETVHLEVKGRLLQFSNQSTSNESYSVGSTYGNDDFEE